ncbi:NAD-binding protein [Fomitiporia mediterranea MF3/22]|uniref:NAD-binding protein n=1 Tax=Fomitiporia mediterranea (strain MF3/22) TaxID=694068 RepID=UPI0004408A37|nr:NAD-binding protein [Fomitiporia mediterranea MF3/22]EJD07792.1 NAD-binding protein [Fomitiporia mediterranea MF3/22]
MNVFRISVAQTWRRRFDAPTQFPRLLSTTRARRSSEDQLVGVKASVRAKADPTFTPRLTLFREFDLTGRVAVVSGANRGLGLEIAQALAEAGATVHCFDLPSTPSETWEASHEYIRRLQLPTARLNYACLDVTDQSATWNAVETASKASGNRLDICVAAAGIIHGACCLDYPTSEFSKVLDVNVRGVFHFAQAAARQMDQAEKGGSIVLIGSAAGSVATSDTEVVAYSASKAAVLQIARSMACELGRKRIRVNSISPGYVPTDLTSPFLDAIPTCKAEWSKQNPLGRLGRSDELRGVAVWLASDASTYCTGSEELNSLHMSGTDHQPPYVKTRENFDSKYVGECFCGQIKFEIANDPVDACYCHWLHGAPYQWAAIIHKDAVHFTEGIKGLTFYNSSEFVNEHKLPCKVLCSTCHSPLADEGRNMILVFPVAVHFKDGQVPDSFKPTYHMFYGSRVTDVVDGVPKFLGRRGEGPCKEK